MNICIVIPAYNEAKTIGALVKKIKEKQLDVVVIDDGSSDQTAQIAESQKAFIIRQKKNSGKGMALQKGFAFILLKGYDGALIMDADGQHSPDDIKQFTDTLKQTQADVITGNRMEDSKDKMPFVRLWTNKIMSMMISQVCGQKIPDTQCGFRYVSAKALRDIQLQCKSYEIETEILIQSSRRGYKIYSVPVRTIYGDETSGINPFLDTFKFFAYFLKAICSSK